MLQVVTFNIGGARGLRPAPHNYDKLAEDTVTTLQQVINPTQPTIIALQESGLAFVNGATKNVGRKMAELLGKDYMDAFVPEVNMRDHPHPNLWDRPSYRGMMHAAEGNAIVTNLNPLDWSWGTYESIVSQKVFSSWTRHTSISRATLYTTGNRDTQPRQLMVSSLIFNDIPLYFMNTHLGVLIGEDRHDPDYERSRSASQMRMEQVREILYVMDELKAADETNETPERAIILAGDFNATLDSPEMEMLQQHFQVLVPENRASEQWTHQSHRILIDHILLHDPSQSFEVLSCHIQNTLSFDDLTDHRPAVAIFDTV